MKIFFAMDLIGGRAVRLRQGDFNQKTVYSEEPLAQIEEMRNRGARDFHIIDLDGARAGSPQHRSLIAEIRRKVPGYMEVGGGIRTAADIDYYGDRGVDGIIVGTRALTDLGFLRGLAGRKNIVLGLDVRDGRPMAAGWQEAVPTTIEELLAVAREAGVLAVLFTSIARDGMLTGPDTEGLKMIQAMTDLPIIASGGVSSITDLAELKKMGLWAAIVGKAYYEGLIGVEEAMTYAD